MKHTVFLLLIVSLFVAGCKRKSEGSKELSAKIKLTTNALYETTALPEDKNEDSADDPAFWLNPNDSNKSTIIGTDKKGGLAVYNLKGEQLFYYPDGNMNNVDIRYNFVAGPDTFAIAACSNRSSNSISIYRINQDGSLSDVAARKIVSQMQGDVYGFCLYQNPDSHKIYAFVNSKNGEIEQWELFATDSLKIDARIARNLKLQSQVEGMVADDENNVIFIGEENTGIWKYNAEPTAEAKGELISMSTETDNENIKYDIEGLAIYYLPNGEGYLLASSQGNYSYAVFQRKAPYKYLGSFRITDDDKVDGTEETDGIEIYSQYLNNDFKHGLFIAQDGYNYENGQVVPQNFKLVPWEKIAKLFNGQVVYN